MRLLDEVAELVPGQRARFRRPLEIREDDFFFDGHFPGEPIVPAVILVEMIAQVGGLAIGSGAAGGRAAGAARGGTRRLQVSRRGDRRRRARGDCPRRRADGRALQIEGEVTAGGRIVGAGAVTLAEARR